MWKYCTSFAQRSLLWTGRLSLVQFYLPAQTEKPDHSITEKPDHSKSDQIAAILDSDELILFWNGQD